MLKKTVPLILCLPVFFAGLVNTAHAWRPYWKCHYTNTSGSTQYGGFGMTEQGARNSLEKSCYSRAESGRCRFVDQSCLEFFRKQCREAAEAAHCD